MYFAYFHPVLAKAYSIFLSYIAQICYILSRFSSTYNINLHFIIFRRKYGETDSSKQKIMTQTYLSESLFFMQEMGLEPTRGRPRQILSLMRLPFRHSCKSLFSFTDRDLCYHIPVRFASLLFCQTV